MALKTRKPTGAASAPLILIEGAEKSGKSWAAAAFSASDKIGATYWIDLGEGSADEYGAIPGARYEIVEHNGTFREIFLAVNEVRQIAQAAADAGAKPVCLVIDSMSAEWELLKDMAGNAMRRRLELRKAKGKSVNIPGPDEEIKPDTDLWNEVTTRHYKLMRTLMTFPGIVLLTARGKETIAMDANGRPIPNVKAYKVEGQKNLAYDVSLWVRFERGHEPMVIGGRSAKTDLRQGKWKPVEEEGLTIEKLVFDLLGYEGGQTRDLVMPDGEVDNPLALDIAADIIQARSRDELTTIWQRLAAAVDAKELTPEEGATLKASIRRKGEEFPAEQAAEPAPQPQSTAPSDGLTKRLYAVLNHHAHLAGDANRGARLAFFSEVVGYPVSSTKDLSAEEIKTIIFELDDKKAGAHA